MTNKRDTYKYDYKVRNKIVHSGITGDLDRREQEHQRRWPSEHLISQHITKSIFNSGVHDESISDIIFLMDGPEIGRAHV